MAVSIISIERYCQRYHLCRGADFPRIMFNGRGKDFQGQGHRVNKKLFARFIIHIFLHNN